MTQNVGDEPLEHLIGNVDKTVLEVALERAAGWHDENYAAHSSSPVTGVKDDRVRPTVHRAQDPAPGDDS